jgi:protease-4
VWQLPLPTLENAMDYIGVNFDGVVTSKHGGWDSTQAIDDDLDKIFAGWGADAYDRFVSFVAESRSQSYDDIKRDCRAAESGLQQVLKR